MIVLPIGRRCLVYERTTTGMRGRAEAPARTIDVTTASAVQDPLYPADTTVDTSIGTSDPPDAGRRTVCLARSPDLIWSGVRVILDSFPDVAIVGDALGVEEATRTLAAMSDSPDLVITAPRAPGLPVHELLPH